jgi:hypothetical protein
VYLSDSPSAVTAEEKTWEDALAARKEHDLWKFIHDYKNEVFDEQDGKELPGGKIGYDDLKQISIDKKTFIYMRGS